MAIKILFGIVILALILLVGLPLALYWSGVELFSFGSQRPSGTKEVLLRSEDQGNTWQATLSEDPRIAFPSGIFDMVVRPENPHIIFMGSRKNGIWKSVNLGKTWAKVFDTSGVLDPAADVYDIEIASSTSPVMYVAVFQKNRGRVLKSENQGASFREVYVTTADKVAVFDLFVNPSDSNHITMITGQGGFFESKNGGATWRVRRWFTEPLIKLIVNPDDKKEMYLMAASGKIFKSVDGGDHWGDLAADAEGSALTISQYPSDMFGPFFGIFSSESAPKTFIMDPGKPSTLYSGSRKGLFRSQDSGLIWKQLPLLIHPEALPIRAVAIDPRSSLTMYVGVLSQLHQSYDGGMTWNMKNIPSALFITKLFIHPLKPDIMFAVMGK